MKKITLIALTLALSVMFVANGFSPHRTVKKESVKTEYVKIIKDHISTAAAQQTPTSIETGHDYAVNIFKATEVTRPPGIYLAYANDANYKNDKKGSLVSNYKNYNRPPLISCSRTMRQYNHQG